MAGRYVPPHLRNKSGNEKPSVDAPPPPEPPRSWVTKEEIRNYFWPDMENEHQDGTLARDDGSRTMHGSAAIPGELAYILLFSDHGKPANPRWETDGIIFTKSSLDLLPGYLESLKPPSETPSTETHATTESDAAPNEPLGPTAGKAETVGHPIAVFKQHSGSRKLPGFVFEGWYKIENTAFLAPHSEDLKRMLEQKWSWTNDKGRVLQANRSGASWEKSFSVRWAVVRLVKDPKADEERGVPEIERLPEPEKEFPKKGVNEMLAEMRLKNSAEGPVGVSTGDVAGVSTDIPAGDPDKTSNGAT